MRCLLFAIAAAHILTADPFQDTADPFQDTSEPAPYTFGTSVVDSAGLQGRIYDLPANTSKLPDFRRLTPVGTIYTSSLNVWPQSFTQGFPGITDRYEWFGIEYTGKIYVEKPGTYRFSILSDDGARLRLNNKTVLSNDGQHGPTAVSSGATLTRGVYEIAVEYFQGPRFSVALVLGVAAPGEPWRIFDMHDFRPPNDMEKWSKGKVSAIQDPGRK
ncbi:PA14 domain-containing protein [Nevskia soli]|uniref:PA14 domain-containing protein n=1 Tax=Nevskia soli TaxID=418856 RepID=UPI001C5CBFAC|nr:PA14 domain-containing protein [Nevskia soli]